MTFSRSLFVTSHLILEKRHSTQKVCVPKNATQHAHRMIASFSKSKQLHILECLIVGKEDRPSERSLLSVEPTSGLREMSDLRRRVEWESDEDDKSVDRMPCRGAHMRRQFTVSIFNRRHIVNAEDVVAQSISSVKRTAVTSKRVRCWRIVDVQCLRHFGS